jgi:hypothetical protein
MAALIAGILFIGMVAANWSFLRPRLGEVIVLLIACHVVGLALSSIQIFALLEFIQVSAAMELRSGFAGGSYQPDDLVPYLLAQLSIFGSSKEQQSLLTFSFGLFGLFFAIRGVVAVANRSVKSINGSSYLAFTIAFLTCMVLFIAKAFGLSETVNRIFLSTPILAESHFPLYFSPLFFIGVAFFAALGLAEMLSIKAQTKRQQLVSILSTAIAIAAVMALSVIGLQRFFNVDTSQFWHALATNPELFSLRVFLLATLVMFVLQLIKMTPSYTRFSLARPLISQGGLFVLGSVVIGLNVIEIANTVPKSFVKTDFILLGPNEATKSTILATFAAAPLQRHELRGANPYGGFAAQGLATVDNGASAILTPQYRTLRGSLFNLPYGGYLPLDKPYGNWSYQAMSANILWVHATPRSNPTWQDYTSDPKIESQLTEWPLGTQILENPFYLQGRTLAQIKKFHGISIWLHFQALNDLSEDFWIEANIASQNGVGVKNDRALIETRWRIRLPSDWLKSEEYKITVRQIDPFSISFNDAQAVSLKLDRVHPKALRGQRLKLLASSEDESQHFFFDHDALPRAFVASSCTQASSFEEEVEFYRRDDAVIRGEVIFPFNAEPTTVPCETYKGDFKAASITQDKQTHLSFEPIQGPALLLLNDSVYPGWQAFDGDHTELTIETANTNSRSVYLAEARIYNVSMKYTPFWISWVYTSLLLAMVFIGIIVWLLRKQKCSV